MPNVVAVTSTGTTGTGTTVSHTITTPACAVGDLLLASLTLNGGHSTVTEASGWTRVYPASIADDGFMSLLVYTRTANATDAAGGAVHTWTTAVAVRSDRGCAAIGGQAASPIDSEASKIGGGATNVSTQITTTVDNTLVLSFLAIDSASENATPTAPLAELWDPAGAGTNTGQVNAAAAATQATAGPTSYVWTWTAALSYKNYLLAIAAPAGTSVTGTASLAVTATITATGATGPGGTAALAVTASVTATGRLGAAGTAALAIAAAIGAAGTLGGRTGAAIAATATLSAAGSLAARTAAALAATATITADGSILGVYVPALYGIDGQGAVWLSFIEGGAATSGPGG